MLFQKAAIFTDIHWGLRNDSELHNKDCLEFIEWFCDRVREHGCDTIIFMGDWFHNKIRTENRTGYYSRVAIELLDDLKLPIYCLLGNHEIYLRNSRDIHSLHHLAKYKNFRLIDTITQYGDVVFSPWMVGDEHLDLTDRKCKYIFGHLELPLFLMNQVIEKAYEGHGLHMDNFYQCEAVYSGHFHKRQVKINKNGIPIYYVGNCFGHDMNDVNDHDRGMSILEWGQVLPTFLSWPGAPRYHRFLLSEFVELCEKDKRFYDKRSTIEIIDDINIPDEMVAEIKTSIDVRKIAIRRPKHENTLDESITDATKYNSLDDMIEDKLKSLSYDGKYDPLLLIDLYRQV